MRAGSGFLARLLMPLSALLVALVCVRVGSSDELVPERKASKESATQRRLTSATNTSITVAPTTTTTTATLFNFTGFLALDQGGNSLPPVVSYADCCQPLAYDTPTKYLRIIAGLRYRLTLISTFANLAINKSKAMLRLLEDVAYVDSDCETLAVVTNFAGEFSILDGKGEAHSALADRNAWEEARVPYSGNYGLCYTSNGHDPHPTWSALTNVTLHAFGTTQEKTRYFCPEELNQTCAITVNLPNLAARVMLLTVAGRCGYNGGDPALQPFQRKTSTTTLIGDSVDHSFGRYLWPADTVRISRTLRICFCDAYEFDVASDGEGPCASSGATDFPQALGYLYLMSALTTPVLLYPGLPFTLRIRCGDFEQGECDATYEVRMRFIDIGPDGTFGEGGVTDLCRSSPESDFYLGPSNCYYGSSLNCDFEPSVVSQGIPAWYFIRIRGKVFNGLVQAQTLGVCYCLGFSDCQQSEDWFRAGTAVINPILVSPDPLVMGVPSTLQLSAVGGAWTIGGGAGSQVLKLLYMPNSTATEISALNCSSARQMPGTLRNFQCSYLHECTPPSANLPTGPMWTDVAALTAGYYAVCYCDYECEQPDRWNFLKQHLVAGPAMVFAGSALQAMNVYAGRTFALTLFGYGFSTSDRLIFLHYDALCGTSLPAPQLHFQEAIEPVLTNSESAGTITSIQPMFKDEYQNEQIGLRVTMAVVHDLGIDDRIRFTNVTVHPTGSICKPVYSPALDAELSHCVEILTNYDSLILAIPSSTQIIVDIKMTSEECATLDVSGASWHKTSQEHFLDLYAERHSQGLYRVCWAIAPESHEDHLAEAGVLTVLKPTTFPSALHLTSISPGADAPSIVAFQLGNRLAYTTAAGPMSFILGFRNVSLLRHFFQSELEGAPQEITREQASQSVCGRLFRELWSSSEDGFPQPQGCFYTESNNEYGMVFPPKSGFNPGYQYQIVMNTVVAGGLVNEHHWETYRFALPLHPFAPEEIRHTAPASFGDVGPVSTTLSCKVACSKFLQCNVAIFRANTDRHCLVADFSRRDEPFRLKTTPEIDGDLTMFMVDRLNRTHSDLSYSGHLTSTTDVGLDLFSMDDMFTRPFEVVEASEAVCEEVVGLAPTAVDPRWNLDDGFKVISEDSTLVDGSPLLLRPEAPLLLLRIRAAPGAPIEAGAAIRIFFWPLTQWQLPKACLVECIPHDPLMRCSRPGCSTSATVDAPWMGSRNSLRVVLATDMTPITNAVTHTLKLQGRYLRIPGSGFMPTKFAAEVQGASSLSAFQPPVDYTQSTGLLPYAALTAYTAILALDENTKPFANDIHNRLYVKLKLGSMLHAGASSSSSLTVQLPVGYSCRSATAAPANLNTFVMAGLSPEGRGQLGAGTWSFSGADCTYNLPVHSSVYGGSAIVCMLTVDNPSGPMGVKDTANHWQIRVSGTGDATTILSLTAISDVTAFSEDIYFPHNVAVLGRLTEISITPTNFWWAAANNILRVFFRTVQRTGSLPAVLLLEAPHGFGFYEYCQVRDLPDEHYAPVQGIYSSLTSEVHRLGPNMCRSTWVPGAIGKRPSLCSITTEYPIEADTNYAFSIQIFHPRFFDSSQRLNFVLTTCAGDQKNQLDRSQQSVPLLEATSSDTYPSYGIFSFEARPQMFEVTVSDLIPYQHSKTPAIVQIRLRPPLDGASADITVQEYSRLVSWRVFAPLGYAWRFSDRTFLHRPIDNVQGITRGLPIRREPVAPLVPPTNILVFPGSNENLVGWEKDQVYGFDTFIHVPPDTPRSAVNEWMVQWGYDMPVLWRRVVAVSVAAGHVRALHSFYVRSLVTKLMATNNELLFQFGTITPIPQQSGALVIEAPTNFVFQAACSTTAPTISYMPYQPVPALMDCVSATMESLHAEGLLRPRVTLRPLDAEIPAGMWVFSLACVNPSSAEVSKFSTDTFVLHSFTNYEEEVVADVAAMTTGFEVMSAMTSATIVNSASYALVGRDDHPGQSSNIVLGFELRNSPVDSGSLVLGVQAPVGFEFEPRCNVVIGDEVFGVGQPYEPPYVAFDTGVTVLSCVGYKHFVSATVTPGLKKGKLYAFKVRVGQQPQFTPQPNQWRLSVGSEQSDAVSGFPLWAFSGMSLAMTQTSRLNPAAMVENVIDLTFVPANTITVKGMVIVIAPADYKIRFDCTVEVFQLDSDRITAAAQVPNTVCKGEQPPINRAQIKFQSEVAAIVRGYAYRMTFQVSNPESIPLFVGRWALQSYEVATEEPDWSGLKDVGQILSIPITDFFSVFTVRIAGDPLLTDLTLTLEFDLSLAHAIEVNDMLAIETPNGFNFAMAVSDPLLEADFRTCIYFRDRPASSNLAELPKPLCAGTAIKFHFRKRHDAGSRFRFQATTEWPQTTLTPLQTSFNARQTRVDSTLATSVAYLTPITPRLLYFQLHKIGARADAVSSSGTVLLSFQTSQAAQFLSITTKVRGLEFTLGARFDNASAEVNTAGQLIKDLLVVHDGDIRLVLAFEVLAGSMYSLIVRNVRNPDIISTVLWSVLTFAKPKSFGRLATPADAESLTGTTPISATVEKAPHLSTPEEVLVWAIDSNLRDEMLEYPAPPTVGRIDIIPAESTIASAFFDFTETRVSFTFTVVPRNVPSGSRLLIFAPDDWTLVPNSFVGESFPEYEDVGIIQCLDEAAARMRFIYVVHLLDDIRASAPCLFNPGQICFYKSKFSLLLNTPQTPNDLERWWRESDQAWLLNLNSDAGSDCGQIDTQHMLFTNDALFSGFLLKESLGGMAVLPEPNGQMSRQRSTIAVEFETRSMLQLSPTETASGNIGIYFRLQTVLGLEFQIGCLAAVPDPDYSSCIGSVNLAVIKVRENKFATGEHRIVVQAINPVATPSANMWTLESFVGVSYEEARVGAFHNVRQRGRAPGYPIWQTLIVEINPASPQRSANTQVFLWFRPSVFVESLGIIEVHAAQSFDMSCIPSIMLISMPIVSCKSYLETSGAAFADLHYVVELQISEGYHLLPNKAYELGIHVRNPDEVKAPAAGTSKDWGVRLRNSRKEVLEANMQMGYYNITDYGFSVVSIIPSASDRYAKNEVRMILQFSKRTSLTLISEIRIVAPIGWDFRPLCARFEDVSGGKNQKDLQLPYSDEKGHHLCLQANLLLIVLDQRRVIEAAVYTLLIGVMNPAAAPPRNFWKVGLLSLGNNLGWRPDQEVSEVSEGELRPGQQVLVETWSMGFDVGERQSNTQEASPLQGVYSEVLSAGAAQRFRSIFLYIWLGIASILTSRSLMLTS